MAQSLPQGLSSSSATTEGHPGWDSQGYGRWMGTGNQAEQEQ